VSVQLRRQHLAGEHLPSRLRQIPKHGKNCAKHDPRSLAELTERSTNSTTDEVCATHNSIPDNEYSTILTAILTVP
jgi:hypothetical protein